MVEVFVDGLDLGELGFERALADEPQNARYAFYLAQSYRDAGQPEKALDAYRKRASILGWEEDAWYPLYEIGA